MLNLLEPDWHLGSKGGADVASHWLAVQEPNANSHLAPGSTGIKAQGEVREKEEHKVDTLTLPEEPGDK